MLRSRRFLLWLPVVALTLFFAACGWRNWHLSMSEEDVWLAIPAYYLTSKAGPSATKIVGKAGVLSIGSGPAPFANNQVTVLSQWNGKASKFTPLTTSMLQKLRQRYPSFRLLNRSDNRPTSCQYFNFGRVRFQNKSAATCEVTFSVRDPKMAEYVTHTGTFVLTRSPLPLSDDRWHITQWNWESLTM